MKRQSLRFAALLLLVFVTMLLVMEVATTLERNRIIREMEVVPSSTGEVFITIDNQIHVYNEN